MLDKEISRGSLVGSRGGVSGDLPFIFSTWLKGLRHGNDWFGLIDSDAYFKHYHEAIEHILADPKTQVKISCLRDDPEVILGYSVSSNTHYHFVFVKKSWRGIGIGRDLMQSTATTVTHLTKVGVSLLKKHPGVKFNPFSS